MEWMNRNVLNFFHMRGNGKGSYTAPVLHSPCQTFVGGFSKKKDQWSISLDDLSTFGSFCGDYSGNSVLGTADGNAFDQHSDDNPGTMLSRKLWRWRYQACFCLWSVFGDEAGFQRKRFRNFSCGNLEFVDLVLSKKQRKPAVSFWSLLKRRIFSGFLKFDFIRCFQKNL